MRRDEQAYGEDEPGGVENLEGSFGGHVRRIYLSI